jgi:hypothetical protein
VPSQLILEIVAGPLAGKRFTFDAHDILLFGRHSQCHARLVKDRLVSRHHFLLEVSPPRATLRDLGSRNGTYVNGVRWGGRELDETPAQGSTRGHPEVNLHAGDRITVGNTTMEVRVELARTCTQCGAEGPRLPASAESLGVSAEAPYLCLECERKLATTPYLPPARETVTCRKCGQQSTELPPTQTARDYVCPSCRDQHKLPAGLEDLLSRARLGTSSTKPLRIDGYELGDMLGKGGMGMVYRAVRQRDGAAVAIKVMLPSVAVSEHARRRFLREIEIVQQLNHPHLVTLLEHGSQAGSFYFVMDYCNGGSIDELVKRHGGKLPLPLAATIMLQCLRGLEHAHASRFIHRDLKPQNLLFHEPPPGAESQRKTVAKISDFGLAKSLETAGLSGMTATGNTGGTYAFMPREQLTDFKRVEPVSDVWSIAATFYYLLCGAHPRQFTRGRDPIEVILQDDAVPLRQRAPEIPPAIAAIIDRALDNAPDRRYQDAGEMRQAMESVLR